MIAALRERVAAWGACGVLTRALMFLLYRRLGEISLRMERMAARFQAGRLWRRVVPAAPKGVRPAGAAVASGALVARTGLGRRVWPGRFGWLVLAGSYQAAGLGSQLRAVLTSPDMVALLTAAPQAVAVLRPLCRALAIETSVLQPGRPVAPPAPAKPRAMRVRKKRPPLDLGRIPLPRGVLSAARREGYGKMW